MDLVVGPAEYGGGVEVVVEREGDEGAPKCRPTVGQGGGGCQALLEVEDKTVGHDDTADLRFWHAAPIDLKNSKIA